MLRGSGPSSEQFFDVSGSNLTANITVTPPTNYEISLTSGGTFTSSPIILTQSGGSVALTTIYVRLKAGLSIGPYNESITTSSTGATNNNIACNGSVTAPVLALPLIENFDYTAGTNLTDNGWIAHSSGGTNPITVSESGLTYLNYVSSEIGNAVLVDNTGEDVSRLFTTVSSGTIYYSFLVNVTTGTSGYFLHLGNSASTFAARIFVKPSATPSKINFGISNTSTESYATTPTDFDLLTTYLVIVKYDVSTNGDASLWVLSSGVPISEAAAGTPEHTTTGSGIATIERVCLRQYSSTQDLIVDGIRLPHPGLKPLSLLSYHPSQQPQLVQQLS